MTMRNYRQWQQKPVADPAGLMGLTCFRGLSALLPWGHPHFVGRCGPAIGASAT